MKKYVYALVALVAISSHVSAQTIVTESNNTSSITTSGETTTNLNSPPPSAISPSINTSNSDLCTVGVAGAVQTQILGLSAGKTVRDLNCERLKNAKTMYDMGMKVAAVSVMCQDSRVFSAMLNAGTPCPFDGLIGQQAKEAWAENENLRPKKFGTMDDSTKSTLIGSGIVGTLLLLLIR